MPSIVLLRDNTPKPIIRHLPTIIPYVYETASRHNTKGASSSIVHHYISQFFSSIKQKVHTAIHMKQYGTIPSFPSFHNKLNMTQRPVTNSYKWSSTK